MKQTQGNLEKAHAKLLYFLPLAWDIYPESDCDFKNCPFGNIAIMKNAQKSFLQERSKLVESIQKYRASCEPDTYTLEIFLREYIIHALALRQAIMNQGDAVQYDMKFRWKSNLKNEFSTLEVTLDDDIALSYLFFSLTQLNVSTTIVESCSEIKDKASKLPLAAEKLRKAAGIIEYLLQRCIDSDQELRPLDLQKNILLGVQNVCCGCAQQLMIAKSMILEETFPVSLVQKLYVGTYIYFETATNLFGSSMNEVTPYSNINSLMGYSVLFSRLHYAQVLLLNSIQAYEKSLLGVAICSISLCKKNFSTRTSVGGYGLPSLTGRSAIINTSLSIIRKEIDDLEVKWIDENQRIYFCPIPPPDSIAKEFESKQIISLIPYDPPKISTDLPDAKISSSLYSETLHDISIPGHYKMDDSREESQTSSFNTKSLALSSTIDRLVKGIVVTKNFDKLRVLWLDNEKKVLCLSKTKVLSRFRTLKKIHLSDIRSIEEKANCGFGINSLVIQGSSTSFQIVVKDTEVNISTLIECVEFLKDCISKGS